MVKIYDWEELDKLFLKEGANVEEFCKKYNIPKTTLRGHLRRMKEKETRKVQHKEEPSQIVPVTLLKTPAQHAGEKQASSSLIKNAPSRLTWCQQNRVPTGMLRSLLETQRQRNIPFY